MNESYSVRLIAEVVRLYPSYITDPLDVQWNFGNAAAVVIEPGGEFHGHIFGDNKAIGQQCYQIATRKVLQVWRTGYPTGLFEELVYSGKLDEGSFGLVSQGTTGVDRLPFYSKISGLERYVSEFRRIRSSLGGIFAN